MSANWGRALPPEDCSGWWDLASPFLLLCLPALPAASEPLLRAKHPWCHEAPRAVENVYTEQLLLNSFMRLSY